MSIIVIENVIDIINNIFNNNIFLLVIFFISSMLTDIATQISAASPISIFILNP